MNFRQLAYGILSFLPGIPDALYKGTGGTVSAEYCYCIWLRHLTLACRAGMPGIPGTVAELGPGDSIGTGLAALLCGAQRYIALDALPHADTERNLAVFDHLVELFRQRASIPDRRRFPEISIDLPDHDFPHDILPNTALQAALREDRVRWLRELVSGERRDPSVLDYRAPWDRLQDTDLSSVDFILTNAVMEHVPDLPGAYTAMHRWLKPGGYASHQIDFRSHSLFNAWDGHWACPDWLWRLFIGRRAYLLNRQPLGTHRALAEATGLRALRCVRDERAPASTRLAPRFRNMEWQDRCTASAYLLQDKPV